MSNARSNVTKLTSLINVKAFGAKGDGTTDDSAAFAAALAAATDVLVPSGTFMVTALAVPAGRSLQGEGLGSVIKKKANGAVISLGKDARLHNLYIDGNGSTYTGVGVTVPFTAEFEGFQQITNCRIYDTASYCVQYVSGSAASGFGSKIAECDLRVTSNTVACIQWGADPTNKHGNRSVINCTAGSGPLLDINTADNGFIIGNTIGDNGSAAGLLWNANCAKIICTGNRIASATAMTLSGQSNVFAGNVVASNVTLSASWIGSRYADNVIAGTFTDSSGGQQNEVDTAPASYTPTWTGGGSNPTLGNGTIDGYYTRRGRLVTMTLNLNIGSTTSMGSGEWRFSLPVGVSSSQPAWGTVLMYDASGTPVVGVFYVAASATYGAIYMHGTVGTVTPTTPFTWADGDFIRVSCTYISA